MLVLQKKSSRQKSKNVIRKTRIGTYRIVKSMLGDVGKTGLSKNENIKRKKKLRNHNVIKKTSQFLIYITMSIEWQGFAWKAVR